MKWYLSLFLMNSAPNTHCFDSIPHIQKMAGSNMSSQVDLPASKLSPKPSCVVRTLGEGNLLPLPNSDGEGRLVSNIVRNGVEMNIVGY